MRLRIKLCGQNVKFIDVTVNSNLGGKILAVPKQFMVSALLLKDMSRNCVCWWLYALH